MKQTKKTPTLRFPEFTDDWEQRKLGDYLLIPEKVKIDIRSQKDLMTVKLNLGGLVAGSNRETLELGSTVYYKRKAGQFIYGKQNFFNGSMAIIPPELDGKATSGDVPSLDIVGISPNYLYTYVSRGDYWKSKKSTASGTGSKRIHEKTLQEFHIHVPSEKEQTKIGAFFQELDQLITLHQCKLEQVQLYKKGMLQKMFPKNGELVPEIRFPEFTGDWEQRKLGEVYNFKNGLNKEKEFFGRGTPIVNFVDVYHKRGIYFENLKGLVDLSEKEIKNFSVQQGDIFFTRTSETIQEIGYPSVMLDIPIDTVFSGFVLRGRAISEDPLTLLFKRYVFFTEQFRVEMQKKSSMTTRALTSGTALKEMEFIYPKNKEEQTKIGAFFQELDQLLTLHQRKLDELKEQKKAFLQQMFV